MSKELLKDIENDLKELSLGVPFLIAGGAPRDIFMGRTFKDIDIYLQVATQADYVRLIARIAESDPFLWVAEEVRDDAYEGLFPLLGVSDFLWRDHKVQFVGFKNESPPLFLRVFNSFDFGMSRIGFSNGEFVITNHFDTDSKDNTFTLYRVYNGNGLLKSIKRYERLTSEKYRDWGLNYTLENLQEDVRPSIIFGETDDRGGEERELPTGGNPSPSLSTPYDLQRRELLQDAPPSSLVYPVPTSPRRVFSAYPSYTEWPNSLWLNVTGGTTTQE